MTHRAEGGSLSAVIRHTTYDILGSRVPVVYAAAAGCAHIDMRHAATGTAPSVTAHASGILPPPPPPPPP
eukprot:CAMPEP_0185322998 /NCGR_PEP_ID=MMETSP1363-20130426/60823_1 /TAXON_ID=38817 /ORGANISM="Gephyrocapsa oceanica, Strain RCC1303" /LENGTH=69 /DNA_ID=CAMNT_0027921561 /DNA_START=91 /DNA_END=298 /DNA_ORIENTATION=-